MSLTNPNDPPEQQVEKQTKIINALMRRADRQKEVGPAAYRAFQSAIELQAQVAAQSRDLARAETELESARYERERTRKALIEAMASMKEGFALFADRQLDICNDLFRNLFPDIADQVTTGLNLDAYLALMRKSSHFTSSDIPPDRMPGVPALVLVELAEDRWYQMSIQETFAGNIVLLQTDISAVVRRNRSETETLIGQQEDYLQAVFRSMSEGVCTFSPNGEVMMQNGRFGEILGLPMAQVQPGKSLREMTAFLRGQGLVTEDVMNRAGDLIQELLNNGAMSARVRHGTGRMLEVQANTLPDGGFLVELKDVTLETRIKEMLENRVRERTVKLTEANKRLREQNAEKAVVEEELRLAKEIAEAAVSSKTQFLAAASHDLLQPINAAKLLISTLKETSSETDFFPMVTRLEGAFVSTEQLLHALLDLSRLESADPNAVQPTTVDLGALLEGVYADQTPVAEKKNVRLTMVPARVSVQSDPVYLLRSIQNLVVNAIQYTEPGGRVLLGCRRRGGQVEVQVWDSGIGIAQEDQVRIFDAFTRGNTGVGGTSVGLGLSVVDRACRHLGHSLTVQSELGRGSVFTIGLGDLKEANAPPEIGVDMTGADELLLDHIVMVIENDPDVLYATTRRLELWGASVIAAASTKQAMGEVVDMGMAPDIILADYQLDHGDTGVTAIAEIRKLTETHVPAIVITADRSEDLRQRGQEQDFSVMTKPVQLSRLRPLIDWKIRRNMAIETQVAAGE